MTALVDSKDTQPMDLDKETSTDDVATKLSKLEQDNKQLKELNDYFKTESEKYKNEAKDAFLKRDKAKKEVRDSGMEDHVALIEQLQGQIKEKDDYIEGVKKQSLQKQKLDEIIKIAKERGLKPIYEDKLNRFIDLDDISVDKLTLTSKMVIDVLENTYPDFFGDESVSSVSKGTPKVTIKTSSKLCDTLIREYKEEMKKTVRDWKKLSQLRQDMDEAGVKFNI